jgi:hypothetical protein
MNYKLIKLAEKFEKKYFIKNAADIDELKRTIENAAANGFFNIKVIQKDGKEQNLSFVDVIKMQKKDMPDLRSELTINVTDNKSIGIISNPRNIIKIQSFVFSPRDIVERLYPDFIYSENETNIPKKIKDYLEKHYFDLKVGEYKITFP